jgi:hypothetical protein
LKLRGIVSGNQNGSDNQNVMLSAVEAFLPQ